jgi:hypothetical protein
MLAAGVPIGRPAPLPLLLVTSLATVTRAEKSVHSLCRSFATIRTGTGLVHWNLVDDSKWAHCLQQWRAALHLGQLPVKSVPGGRVVEQL